MNFKLLFFIFLNFFTYRLSAQKVSLKVGANFQQIPKQGKGQEIIDYFIFPDRDNPNQLILEKHTYILGYETYYQFKHGGQIAGTVSFLERSGFSLKTGLELSYNVFSAFRSLPTSTNDISREFVRYIDTTIEEIPATPTTPVLIEDLFSTRCDTFTNSISDFGSNRTPTNYYTLALNIPLILEYEIIENRVSIDLEGYFSIPLKTKASSLFFQSNRDSVAHINNASTTFCSYSIGEIDGNFRSNWRNYNLGLDLGVKLWFGKHGMEISYGKQFTNTFITAEQQDLPRRPIQANPYKIELNYIYLLNDRKEYITDLSSEPIYKHKRKRKRKKKKRFKLF